MDKLPPEGSVEEVQVSETTEEVVEEDTPVVTEDTLLVVEVPFTTPKFAL